MNFFYFIFCCVLLTLLNLANKIHSQETGEPCDISGKPGICILQESCTSMNSADMLQTCKLNADGTPIICCPHSSTSIPNPEENSGDTGGTQTRFYIQPASKKYYNTNKNTNYYYENNPTQRRTESQVPTNTWTDYSVDRPVYYNTEGQFNQNSYDSPSWGITKTSTTYKTKKPATTTSTTQRITDAWSRLTKSTTKDSRPTTKEGKPVWSTVVGTTQQKRPTTLSSRKRVSEQKCEEYSKLVTKKVSALPLQISAPVSSTETEDCEKAPATLIVGGTKAKEGEFPHMAAVGFSNSGVISYNCGGTLISDRFVMTAAHCTKTSLNNPTQVKLGQLNIGDYGSGGTNYKIMEVIVHPEYKPPQLYNDIALLKLQRQVTFTKFIRPACLYPKYQLDSNKVIATGWGATNFAEQASEDLLKVGLDIVDQNLCGQLYGPDTKLKYGITRTMTCASVLVGGKDTCVGDSGGPIEMPYGSNKCVHYVVGVTSFGKECGKANSPAIYTRVSEYLTWIEGIVWK